MLWMFSYLEEGREGTLNSFLFPYGWPAVPTLFIQWLIHFLLIWNATYSSYQISTYAWVCFRYCFIDLSIPEYDFNFRNFKIYIAILGVSPSFLFSFFSKYLDYSFMLIIPPENKVSLLSGITCLKNCAYQKHLNKNTNNFFLHSHIYSSRNL